MDKYINTGKEMFFYESLVELQAKCAVVDSASNVNKRSSGSNDKEF